MNDERRTRSKMKPFTVCRLDDKTQRERGTPFVTKETKQSMVFNARNVICNNILHYHVLNSILGTPTFFLFYEVV